MTEGTEKGEKDCFAERPVLSAGYERVGEPMIGHRHVRGGDGGH